MIKIIILASAACFLASPSAAYVSGGHSYKLTCNTNGYVLSSEAKVTRFVEAGAGSWIWNKTEKIYLGRSCDAQHELFGRGQWCWANGGFRVDFDQHAFGFPRQELYCPDQEDVGMQCVC